MTTEPLQRLHLATLRTLASALRDGALSSGLSGRALSQITGPHAGPIETYLRTLIAQKMTCPQIANVVDAIADTKERSADPALLLDLVLSGPDVPGIPTGDTGAVMHSLVEAARQEILLVGYAVHNGEKLFARLAERMRESPDLRVVFCLDISRTWHDDTPSSEIVHRFTHDFQSKHWPWQELPEIYYDPRSLETAQDHRSSLHAKCIVIDRSEALITSANFTEAAQQRNIEAGLRVRHSPIADRLAGYFEALIMSGQLKKLLLERRGAN